MGIIINHDIGIPIKQPLFHETCPSFLFCELNLEKLCPPSGDVLYQVGLDSRLPFLVMNFQLSCRKLQKSEKIGFGKRPTIFSTLGLVAGCGVAVEGLEMIW